MTPAEIKDALRRNKAENRWPSSLYQLAQARRCNRSTMTKALQDPKRYGAARRYIETQLRLPFAEPDLRALTRSTGLSRPRLKALAALSPIEVEAARLIEAARKPLQLAPGRVRRRAAKVAS